MMRIIAIVLTAFTLLMGGCSHGSKRPSASPQSPVVSVPQLPPLIAAAAAGQPETVRRLLDQGADVGVRSSVPHDRTALEAAIWHRQNDIERLTAVPNDPGGESMRNQPMPPDGALKDENYREVIGMLRQAIKDEVKK